MQAARSMVSAVDSRSSPAPWVWLNELAAELHDGPVQIVSAVSMRLALLEEQGDELDRARTVRELGELRRLLGTAIDEMRAVCADARLSGSARMEPVALIRAAVRTHAIRYGAAAIPVRLSVQQRDAFCGRMSPGRRHCLTRFVQEALSNAQTHARPNGVVLTLREERRRMAVRVCDDGIGMPDREPEDGHGLHAMARRAELQDGNLRIASALGVGTCLSLSFFDRQGKARS